MHQPRTMWSSAAPHSHVLLDRVIPLIPRSPLHGLLSRNLMLITFFGRRSGRQFTIPVTYPPSDGTLLVFSNQRRWKNLRGGAAVPLRLRGRDVPGIAGPIEDAATVAREVQTFLARKDASATRTIDVQLDPQREPTGTEIVERTRGHVVLYITPDRGS